MSVKDKIATLSLLQVPMDKSTHETLAETEKQKKVDEDMDVSIQKIQYIRHIRFCKSSWYIGITSEVHDVYLTSSATINLTLDECTKKCWKYFLS